MTKMLALIREAECIGCTKCIDVCPVDAILGSAKQMHTVIGQECIGCKLCIPPCPVDCIDLIPAPESQPRIPPEHVKSRYQARKKRLTEDDNIEKITIVDVSIIKRKKYIQEAITRVRTKKT